MEYQYSTMTEQVTYDTNVQVPTDVLIHPVKDQQDGNKLLSAPLNQIPIPDNTNSNYGFNQTEPTVQQSLTKEMSTGSSLKVSQNSAVLGNNNSTTVSMSWANRVKATNVTNESSALISTQTVQPATNANTTQPVISTTVRESVAVEEDIEIDSALLAGMCDAKERIALLRLETVLLDFMHCEASWLEVGGPYNSTVYSDNNRLIVRNTDESATSLNGFPEPVPGQRQTSFQKCILHKCADRFKIIREPGIMLFGALRLIKLSSSKIPTRLLKDLDPSEYLNNANVYDSRQSYNTNHNYEARQQQQYATPTGINNSKVYNVPEQQSTATIASLNRSLGNVTVTETREGTAPPVANTNTGVTTGATMKPKKMKIMKRADKPNASASIDSAQQKKFLRKHSSELSEKEKAYAEARARIFNEESAASSLVDVENKSSVTPTDTNTETESGSLSDILSSSVPVPEALHTDSSETTRRPDSPSQVKEDVLASTSASGQNGENLQQSSSNGSSSNLPLLESKAVYRNRAEEAADPDFRRHRNNHMMVSSAPMFGISPSVVPTGPLHTQSATTTIPSYSNTPSWIQSTVTPYPTMHHPHLQSQVMQQPPHAAPYQVQTTARQHAPPQYQQYPSQHYMYQQQPYPMQVPMYDVGMSPMGQAGNVASAGKFQHQQQHQPNVYKDFNNGGRYYNNNSTTGSNVHYQNGNAMAKQRNAATLKAAAPAFYPSKPSQSTPNDVNSNIGDSVKTSDHSEEQI
jgi:SUZ domain